MRHKVSGRLNLFSAFLWTLLFSITLVGGNDLSQKLHVLAQEQTVASADQVPLQGALQDRYNTQTQKPTGFRAETILQQGGLKKSKDLNSPDPAIVFEFHNHVVISLFSSYFFSRVEAAFSVTSSFQPRGPPAFIPSFI